MMIILRSELYCKKFSIILSTFIQLLLLSYGIQNPVGFHSNVIRSSLKQMHVGKKFQLLLLFWMMQRLFGLFFGNFFSLGNSSLVMNQKAKKIWNVWLDSIVCARVNVCKVCALFVFVCVCVCCVHVCVCICLYAGYVCGCQCVYVSVYVRWYVCMHVVCDKDMKAEYFFFCWLRSYEDMRLISANHRMSHWVRTQRVNNKKRDVMIKKNKKYTQQIECECKSVCVCWGLGRERERDIDCQIKRKKERERKIDRRERKYNVCQHKKLTY